jgi:hypothetical protein
MNLGPSKATGNRATKDVAALTSRQMIGSFGNPISAFIRHDFQRSACNSILRMIAQVPEGHNRDSIFTHHPHALHHFT